MEITEVSKKDLVWISDIDKEDCSYEVKSLAGVYSLIKNPDIYFLLDMECWGILEVYNNITGEELTAYYLMKK